MKTLIVLVTYDSYALTQECLSRLSELSESEWKIAVADNGSRDGTPERIQREFPRVSVFKLKENRGFGYANNEAVRQASRKESFDFVCFLNNDTIPSALALERLRDSAMRTDSKVIFAPTLKNGNGSPQRNDYRFPSHLEFFLNAFRGKCGADKILRGNAVPVPGTEFLTNEWINAVCWLMPFNAFQAIGGFDEKIFMYYEDTDFALRAKNRGFRFYLDTKASIVHLGGASAKSSLSQSLQHDSSQLYFYRKHYGKTGAFVSRSFRIVRSLVRLILLLPSCPFRISARKNFKLHVQLFHFALGSSR